MLKKFVTLLILALVFTGCNLAKEEGQLSTSSGGGEEMESREESLLESSSPPDPALEEEPSNLSQGSDPPSQVELGTNSSSTPQEPARSILSLTIPEGYTLARIGMLLEEKGVCSVEEFIKASQTMDVSSFPLVAAQSPDPNRCFRLEGYLFPDTYQIYSDDSAQSVILRMLNQLEQRLSPALRKKIQDSGYTLDQVLTLASIIEKEAFGPQEMPGISSVLHNRLDGGMKLQCDVSITYVEGAIKPFIGGDVNRYNAHYNTYKCKALPAGPICNPGLKAIEAAVTPAESNYYYFLTDGEKNYHYARTFEEHQENIAKLKPQKPA